MGAEEVKQLESNNLANLKSMTKSQFKENTEIQFLSKPRICEENIKCHSNWYP